MSTDSEVSGPGAAVPLLEPRDGLPPVVETDTALAEATGRLAEGHGPVAVCLAPGTYTLSEPLVLGTGLDGITLRGGEAVMRMPSICSSRKFHQP